MESNPDDKKKREIEASLIRSAGKDRELANERTRLMLLSRIDRIMTDDTLSEISEKSGTRIDDGMGSSFVSLAMLAIDSPSPESVVQRISQELGWLRPLSRRRTKSFLRAARDIRRVERLEMQGGAS